MFIHKYLYMSRIICTFASRKGGRYNPLKTKYLTFHVEHIKTPRRWAKRQRKMKQYVVYGITAWGRRFDLSVVDSEEKAINSMADQIEEDSDWLYDVIDYEEISQQE